MSRRAFTLIELLVVIAIIAVLMGILMPSLHKIRDQARAVSCKSNLKQWGLIWHMYTEENGGVFNVGVYNGSAAANDWPVTLLDYYRAKGELALCPSAKLPMADGRHFARSAWSWDRRGWGDIRGKDPAIQDAGSYGQNEWLCNRSGDNYWKNRYRIKRPLEGPLFMDCAYLDVFPSDSSGPPASDEVTTTNSEWNIVCIDRHFGAINCVFADFSTVRRVGLKELWRFKWHRNFNVRNRWTQAGGVTPEQWPHWMRTFSD